MNRNKKYHPHILASFLMLIVVGALFFSQNQNVFGSDQVQFSQSIFPGVKSIDIVDGSGNSLSNPSANFATLTFSFGTQQSNATLGTSSQKLRVINPTGTATWNASMAALSGNTALWDDGNGNNYDFNSNAAQGRLGVDATAATITPQGGCSNTDISKTGTMHFAQGSLDSINLISAGNSAQLGCYWDITGINLIQDIPASQKSGNYKLDMALTIS